MSAEAGLASVVRNMELQLGQIAPETTPIGGRARIVLPDHDRLRVLVPPIIQRGAPGAVEFQAEDQRLGLHEVADAISLSRIFSSVSIVEQNDTTAPDLAGADTLIWFQVRSLNGNAGPWIGQWQMRRESGPAGRVIGVTKSVLGLAVATATGLAPQNVNFATKTDIASRFLAAYQITLDEAPGRAAISPAAIADLARRFTVRVECLR